MLHTDAAETALVTGLWAPLAVALITAAGSVAIGLMGRRADDLKRAERLSQVLDSMEPSPERTVVATIRDDYAVSWALRQAAPAEHGLRWGIRILTVLGGIALAGAILVGIYVGLGYGRVSDWFFWVYYGVGLSLLLGAGWLRAVANRRGRVWIGAERSRRALREPLHENLRLESTGPTRRVPRAVRSREPDETAQPGA
jgi:hypothetical protein